MSTLQRSILIFSAMSVAIILHALFFLWLLKVFASSAVFASALVVLVAMTLQICAYFFAVHDYFVWWACRPKIELKAKAETDQTDIFAEPRKESDVM